MAATVTSKIIVTLQSLLANAVGLATAQATVETGINSPWASGVAANQADRIYTENDKSISAAYDVDLAGALVDALGAACVFAKIKAILVVAAVANTGNVIVGNDAASITLGFGAITHTWAVPPGGLLLVTAPALAGWAVTPTTGDILQFTPSAGTQVFDFAILGTSA